MEQAPDATEQMSEAPPTTLGELAALFTRLGFTAFGGPAAHVALMEDQFVHRRKWLDRQHFLDLIAAVNFIPGPNSTELAIHIGQLRAGTPGLFVAGACFIAPAMLIILPLAWAYVKWGSLPVMLPALHAIAAAVVAVVAFATWRFGRTAVKNPLTCMLMILAVIFKILANRFLWPQPELLALAAAATTGAAWHHRRSIRSTRLLAIAIPPAFWPDLLRMALVLLKIGATLFGSGYVLLSYLQTDMVDHRGWLTHQQLTDAIGVGQFTPGPLLTTSTFVGYFLGNVRFGGGIAGGIIGGIVATMAIFLPSFLLVWIFGPLLQRIRKNESARGALDGMNAAVVGLMIVVAWRLALPAVYNPANGRIDPLGVIIIAISIIALWKKLNATWLILAAGLLGAVLCAFLP